MAESIQEAALKAREQYLSNRKENNGILKKTLEDLGEAIRSIDTEDKAAISLAMLEIVKYLNSNG